MIPQLKAGSSDCLNCVHESRTISLFSRSRYCISTKAAEAQICSFVALSLLPGREYTSDKIHLLEILKLKPHFPHVQLRKKVIYFFYIWFILILLIRKYNKCSISELMNMQPCKLPSLLEVLNKSWSHSPRIYHKFLVISPQHRQSQDTNC